MAFHGEACALESRRWGLWLLGSGWWGHAEVGGIDYWPRIPQGRKSAGGRLEGGGVAQGFCPRLRQPDGQR